MKKISVENPKESLHRLFIKIWYGFLAGVPAILLSSGSHSVVGYGGVAILLIFGSVMFYRSHWALVDEVFDCDEYLLFRKGQKEFAVPLSSIERLSHPFSNSTDLITVDVADSSGGPNRFTFRAAESSGWFKVPALFGELQGRVKQARKS